MDSLKTIRVLSWPETVQALGLSERTCERLRDSGDFPPKTYLSEHRIGFRVCDIEDWLDARRAPQPKPIGEAAQQICANVRDVMREKQKLLKPLK